MKILAAVVALVVLVLIGSRLEGRKPETLPAHHARLVSLTCSPNYGRPRADVTFQNTGQTTIEYPKVAIMFGDASNDGHLSPRPLRPGGTAQATVYSPVKADSGCSLLSLQDGDGVSVSVDR